LAVSAASGVVAAAVEAGDSEATAEVAAVSATPVVVSGTPGLSTTPETSDPPPIVIVTVRVLGGAQLVNEAASVVSVALVVSAATVVSASLVVSAAASVVLVVVSAASGVLVAVSVASATEAVVVWFALLLSTAASPKVKDWLASPLSQFATSNTSPLTVKQDPAAFSGWNDRGPAPPSKVNS
jgi:hypothetical protein